MKDRNLFGKNSDTRIGMLQGKYVHTICTRLINHYGHQTLETFEIFSEYFGAPCLKFTSGIRRR